MERFKYNRGFAIVGAIVAIALVALMAVLYTQVISDYTITNGRMTHKVHGEQVLVDTAVAYQNQSYDGLKAMCDALGAWTAGTVGPVVGNCTVGGQLNKALPAVDPANPSLVNSLRKWNGDFDNVNGTVCLELTQCTQKAGNILLEVTLTGYWPDAKPSAPVVAKKLVFRKTRW